MLTYLELTQKQGVGQNLCWILTQSAIFA